MVQCPICKEEMMEKKDEGYYCEKCKEVMPLDFAEAPRPSCGCGHGHDH